MDRIEPRRLSPSGRGRPLALVADDTAVSRVVLRSLLDDAGYDVIEAQDGAVAVELFQSTRPDIVFMDMVMPVMDGLTAAMRIKVLGGEAFVPVIFVTSGTDECDLARCVDCGGDDFLVKPYNRVLLEAKIRSLERIRALQQRTGALIARRHEEEQLARRIQEGAVMGPNVRPPALRSHMAPAATFNGDVLLAAYSPDGDLHVLLGDFTGHGLAATIGALPAAETFRAMTSKGFRPAQILSEINRKLRSLLPTGMFLAAVFLRVDAGLKHLSVINCGMPDAWLVDGDTVQTGISSSALPLAVTPEGHYEGIEVTLPVPPGGHVLLFSDGVLEAGDAFGGMLGTDRLRAAVAAGARRGDIVGGAVKAIDAFRNGIPLTDDVGLVDVHLVSDLFADAAPAAPLPARGGRVEHAAEEQFGWRVAIELRGHALRETSPVPLVMSLLKEFPGLDAHRPALFTVLAELYNNALDHGVLELESSLKGGDFATYLQARDAKLDALGGGRVGLEIDCSGAGDSGRIAVCLEDSGKGFDPGSVPAASAEAPHGRGIALVNALCRSLAYEEPGNRVRAVYAMSRDARTAGPEDAPA